MNQPSDDFDPREWDAQERARRAAKPGASAATGSGDSDAHAYRRVAVALRMPPNDTLPSNFAWQVAQRAAAGARRTAQPDLRVERWLLIALVAAMGIAAVVVALIYGNDWMRAATAGGRGASLWAVLLGGCVLVSWGLQSLRDFRHARR